MLRGVAGPFDGTRTEVMVGGTRVFAQGLAAPAGSPLMLSIRPELLSLSREPHGFHLDARLQLREFLGPVQRLHAALPDGTRVRISALSGQAVPAGIGDMLCLSYDPAQIILFTAAS